MQTRRRLSLATIAMLAAACGDLAGPEQTAEPEFIVPGRACSPESPVFDVPVAARDSLPQWPNSDQQWADIARRVPGGWGGYFHLDGVSTMYLVEPGLRGEATEALRGEGIPPATDVLQGRWDFAQLYDWSRYLDIHGASSIAGFVSADIDVSSNRIMYGLESSASFADLTAVATALGIPCNLLAAQVEVRAEPL